MKKLKVLLALFMCIASSASLLTGCGQSVPEGFTSITFWMQSGTADAYYREMVETYNNGQGQEDKVYVQYFPKGSDYYTNLGTTLNSRRAPEVMIVNDQYFKNYAAQGLFVNLDEKLADDSLRTKDEAGDPILDLNEIPSKLVDRFRLDMETRRAGTGTTLYGVPNGDVPTIIFYNAEYFRDEGINIISVAEEELDAYNEANGTQYMPHGYAEYTPDAAPAEGLTVSKTLNGEEVVKVFNNRIPMNWEELVGLSKYFTKVYNTESTSTYGFLNEWWFSYGWSVGGDCIGYNSETGHYEFTLGSEDPNYLVVENVTINGTPYEAGEILLFKDRSYVAEQNATGDFMTSLYELPSTYDAFAEFCALSFYRGVPIDSYGKTGYGISPSPKTLNNDAKMAYLTSGTSAMVCDSYLQVPNYLSNDTIDVYDVAPLYQYREYEGGSLDDSDNLKIIGKEYSNGVYTGALKTVGSQNTPIVGYKGASSLTTCYVIPSAADSSKYEAAWKFIQWAASEESQAIIAQGNTLIPNQIEYAHSEEFASRSTNLLNNVYALSDMALYTDIGDWSYLEDGEWVHPWSNILNNQVRNGEMTLDDFFQQVTGTANEDLAADKYKIVITTK